jgi:hypothetical protein
MPNYISTISYAFMASTGTILLKVYFKDHQPYVSTFYLTYHSQSNLSTGAKHFRWTEDCRKQSHVSTETETWDTEQLLLITFEQFIHNQLSVRICNPQIT